MNRLSLVATCLGCALLAIIPTTVFAATITVTNTASTGPGTLDEAIFNSFTGDTIVFDVPLPATINLQDGPEFLEEDVTITGPGANQLTINGDGTNRIFFIDGTTVTISGLTISNGVTHGAIINFGTLTISECVLKNNLSKGGDGNQTNGGGGAGAGGAILNGSTDIFNFGPATLFVVNSTFSDNHAIGGGGDHGGGGGAGLGGAIFNADGIVVLSNCTFSANSAVGGPSGITGFDNGDNQGNGGNGLGNSAAGFGAFGLGIGIDGVDAGTGCGGGAASDGEQSSGICDGGNGGNGGKGGIGGGGGAGGPGADGCVVVNPGDGGNGGNGGNGGDGEFGGGGGGAGAGGNPTGVGTLTGSVGTPAAGGLGAGSGVLTNGGAGAGFGGAIFTYAFAETLIFNCTIVSNSATGGASAGHLADGIGIGGGIYNFDGFVDDVSTIVTGHVEVLNTIIASNTANSALDVGGVITSNGHNLIGIGDGSSGFINGTNGDLVGDAAHPLDPKLGPLANNGGPTFTQALLPGSPAINAGADVGCAATDQRGVTRPQILHCDIGAFELDDTPPVAICHNVVVTVVSNCSANASIDNGSSDPDAGDSITLSQSPPGPYALGVTIVTLTATDHHGATNSCAATVTVIDNFTPTIICPSNITVSAVSPTGTVVFYTAPTVIGGCGTTVTSTPSSGSLFGIGNTTVTCTAADPHGLTNSCTFNVRVKTASESITDAETLIQNLGLDSRLSKKLIRQLKSIATLADRGRTRSACKQLVSLFRTAERELNADHLTVNQTIQITTPLGQVFTVLGCP